MTPQSIHTDPYIPTRVAAPLTAALLVAGAALAWAAAGYDLGEIRTLASLDTESLAPEQMLAHARAGELLRAAQLVFAVVLAGAFLPWLHQARANVRALGARRLHHGREWAYLGFLIPGVNLVRPYQVVSEVWRASDPATLEPLAWQERPTPPLVGVWWATLVAWALAECGTALLLQAGSSLASVQLAHALSLAGDASAAVAASAGSWMVLRIARDQDAKWRALGHADTTTALASGRIDVPA